ncbi:MAG: hypothetical protein EX271_12040 [Acidimicrobiales bacterium]|nr:hypothetical protein [Hyphomonadaceae bacterium]RZV36676.1 MAG: hypothetical protein EX271_12040 [Acidimicrobiales bacterium]
MGMPFDFKRDVQRDNFQIGNIIVVPTRDIILKNRHEYVLEPLAMDLLCILAEQPGEVMMREELINRLWDLDNGGDENLTRAVSVLRKALKQASTDENYIETIPKRGYRLTHPVSEADINDVHNGTDFAIDQWRQKGSLLPTALIILLISIPVVIVTAMGN